MKLTITKEFREAYSRIEDGSDNIFLTGRAGTGKSTLLKYFRDHTNKKYVVLAPTGVAALNVKGQTIHSFFGFHPEISKDRVVKASPENIDLFKALEVIVIDEISMVRADLLDCVDRALRLNRGRMKEPFGGVQMVFIGDLFQLPPVVTRDETERFQTEYPSPYFFSSDVIAESDVEIIELQKVFRQKDAEFVKLLNNVRVGTIGATDVLRWNELYDAEFDPGLDDDYIVHLTTTNRMAKERNDYELGKLDTREWTLKAQSYGDIGGRKMPSDSNINVKVGARIMFTTNDSQRRWVNGSLGEIEEIEHDGLAKFPTLHVRLDDGGKVEVDQYKWEVFEYEYADGSFNEEVVGTYSQFPIALAWAVTIHKAQGKTFDRILVDVGWGAFAHGQMYVALSRATEFEGVTLLKPFRVRDVIVDQAVLDFLGD